MKKILFLGPPGSGKSTQAKLLAKYLKLPVVSTGDIFRQLPEVREILQEGKLVDDWFSAEIVRKRLNEKDCQSGFMLDGYPRTLEQVKIFDPKFDIVFYLSLPVEVAISRLLKRGRKDDTREAIKKRLDLYHQKTKPLLDYYQDLGILKKINAAGSIAAIQKAIRSKLIVND